MPIHSTITAISGSYPDIAVNSDKYPFEKLLFILIGIFYLMASRSDDLCYDKIVITSDRRECGDLMMIRQRHEIATSLRSSQRRLRQPRLVNNQG